MGVGFMKVLLIDKNRISKYLGNNIKLLDMSECLPQLENNGNSRVDLYFSDINESTINIINNILYIKDYKITKNSFLK